MHAREDTAAPRPAPSARWLAAALLIGAVVLSAQTRIRVAFADPHFDRQEARRLLWSDPALLYYFTALIVEHGGAAPPGLRDDARVQWPDRVDDFELETIGQEYVAAWWHLLLGRGEPLHVSCVRSMAWAAALTALGVFGLAAELTGSVRLGGFAALVFALLPANYRTIGFILIREDFALPWFALHLWLLARAARRRTAASFVACGLALLAALATWHAMGFVVALEAAVVLAWFLRGGANPLAVGGAWLVPAVAAAGSFAVPALRAKFAVLSLPMQIAFGLLAAALFQRVRPGRPLAARAIGVLGVGTAAGAAHAASRLLGGGMGDYSHVFELMAAKVRWLGELPADPGLLDFEARLLWQGPFVTGSVAGLLQGLTVAAPALAWLIVRHVPTWARGRGEVRAAWLAAFCAAALAVAWLVDRTQVVIGMAAPAALAVACGAIASRPWRRAAVAASLLVATAFMALFVSRHRILWYGAERTFRDGRVAWEAHPHARALPPLLSWIERSLPPDAAIAADMVTSTALLAHTRRPILLQPKYESAESRRRIEEFLDAWYHRTPADLASWLERHRARHLVVHAGFLGPGSLYLAGLRDDGSERPGAGSSAAAFLGRPAGVPGFRLLHPAPFELDDALFRVYELE